MRLVCLLVRTKNLRQSDGLHFISDSLNLTQDVLFSDIFFCPPVFSVVVISIRINSKTPQQPPDAEQIPMFIDESICL